MCYAVVASCSLSDSSTNSFDQFNRLSTSSSWLVDSGLNFVVWSEEVRGAMTMWSPLTSLLLCARAARYRPLTGTAAFVIRVCMCVSMSLYTVWTYCMLCLLCLCSVCKMWFISHLSLSLSLSFAPSLLTSLFLCLPLPPPPSSLPLPLQRNTRTVRSGLSLGMCRMSEW